MNVIDLIDYIVVEDQLRNVDANIVILFNKQFSSTTRALLRSPTTILVVGSRPLLTFDFHQQPSCFTGGHLGCKIPTTE